MRVLVADANDRHFHELSDCPAPFWPGFVTAAECGAAIGRHHDAVPPDFDLADIGLPEMISHQLGRRTVSHGP